MPAALRRLTVPALCLILTSCDTDAPTRRQPLDSAISIAMHEDLGATARTLRLRCRTEKIYGCSNNRLSFLILRSWSGFSIEFKGIEAPDICLTSLGPATADIGLGSLAEGVYTLRLVSSGAAVTARLAVTRDSFAIVAPASELFRFPNHALHRVPEHTVWGIVGYASSTLGPKVQQYFDALKAIGATDRSLAPGDYEYFSVEPGGWIKSPESMGYYFAQPYVFEYAGSSALLPGVVGSQSDSLWISLYTDRGERYFSWVPAPAP